MEQKKEPLQTVIAIARIFQPNVRVSVVFLLVMPGCPNKILLHQRREMDLWQGARYN